jgi:hypothetical protein
MHSKWGPIVLIIIGVVILGANLGWFSSRELGALAATYWPVILIVIGAVGLITGRTRK